MNANPHDVEGIRSTLIGMLEKELRIDAVDPDKLLTQYGLDSISALTVAGELEDMLGVELPPTLLWDCPTVNQIADYLGNLIRGSEAVAA
jgi:acyl carrier protein